jgi:hypothetical protein
MFKIGSKYTIQFHDHCKGDSKMICEVTLWITKEDKSHVYGTWWHVLDQDQETTELNREMVSIIKSTVIKKRKLASL